MTRRRRRYKKNIQKHIQKLKRGHSLVKRQHEENVNALKMELWNKNSYIKLLLEYLASISRSPWDIEVFKGFFDMCQ